jgi:RNA polymerase-binding transcription factor DksA
MLSRDQKPEIQDIDRALVKLESNRYGTCEVCGQDSYPSRGEAFLETTGCVSCAEAGESPTALRT